MARGTRLHDDPIELWRSSLNLSQRALPSPGPATRHRTVKDYLPSHFLPWEPVAGHLSTGPTRSWRHTVFAGLLPYRTPLHVAGLDRNSSEAEPTDPAMARTVALFVLSVAENGAVQPETLELSRLHWTAALLSDQGQVTSDFAAVQASWRQQVADLFRERRVRIQGVRYGRLPDDAEQEHLLEHADLAAALELTREILGPPGLVPRRPGSSPVRVLSRLVPDGSAAQHLLNHPGAEHLDRAADATRYRQGAASLLGVDVPEDHEDVRSDREVLYRAVAPQEVPSGCLSTEAPTLATQFVVNRSVSELSSRSGVWAVPAETAGGMPSERSAESLLAALVVERALSLARFPDPAEAFDPEPLEWGGGRTVNLPHPDLTGTEAVWAAPGRSARPGRSPFSATVRLLPGLAGKGPYQGFEAGRSVDAISAVDAVLNALPRRPQTMEPADYERWDEKAEALVAAEERARALLDERQRYHEAVPMLIHTEEMSRDLGEAQAAAVQTVEETEERLEASEQEQRLARQRSQYLADQISVHLPKEPGLWRKFLAGRRGTASWRGRLEHLREEQAAAHAREQEAQVRVDAAHRTLRQARHHLESLHEEEAESRDSAASLREELAAYPYPQYAINRDWLVGRWGGPETPCPWLDPRVQDARAAVYRRAVDLHCTALEFLGAEFRANLLAARDILRGKDVRDPLAARAAWQTLTAVFPEVRVDAELLPGLLSALGRHRLGWVVFEDSRSIHPGVAYAGLLNARRGLFLDAPADDAGPRERADRRGTDGGTSDGRTSNGNQGTDAGTRSDATGGTSPRPAWRPEEVSDVEAAATRYTTPPRAVQEQLARATGCSERWLEIGPDAYALARTHSR